jgi:threonylcarbamoyladenosine tRNA methylthiotransferase MtaB
VTVARGDERSRSVEEIVEDIRRFDEQGINEAVLTGVHVGGFGSDNESSLFELVEKILADTDIQRLRFASVEPWDLPDHFFSLFNDKRVMPHMHLPLQSGSDTVLRRMSRRCKTQEFSALVDKARSHVDGFNVTSDIIVGFPGETEQEWQQTMKFVESTGFGHLHIFPYSPRTGTKAARLDDQIDTQTKRRRIKELTELANAMKKTSLQKAINTTQSVLWEKPSKQADGQIIYHGYTPNFHRVKTVVSGNNSLEHQVTDTNITAIDSTDLALTGITTDRDD